MNEREYVGYRSSSNKYNLCLCGIHHLYYLSYILKYSAICEIPISRVCLSADAVSLNGIFEPLLHLLYILHVLAVPWSARGQGKDEGGLFDSQEGNGVGILVVGG